MNNRKRTIDPDRWYRKDDKLSIALMMYYVLIKDNKTSVDLDIYVDSQVALTLKFINEKQAIAFTEDVVNNYFSLEEIENEYISYINGSKWYDDITETNSRLDSIESIFNDIIKLDKKLTDEYYDALVKRSNIADSDSYSEDEVNNYNIYLNHLNEQYNRLLNLKTKFVKKLEIINKNEEIKELEKKHNSRI